MAHMGPKPPKPGYLGHQSRACASKALGSCRVEEFRIGVSG